MKGITVIAPTRNTVIWITPEALRKIALELESKAKKTKGHFSLVTIGTKESGQVDFQYNSD